MNHPTGLICRLLGHRWGEWYDCLRPGLCASECSRCTARRFIDRYVDPSSRPWGAYSYEEAARR